jgi:hypothetical protein
MQSLNTMVLQGKVLYLGVSDTPAWVVSKANEYARQNGMRQFSVYQGRWSAEHRDFERYVESEKILFLLLKLVMFSDRSGIRPSIISDEQLLTLMLPRDIIPMCKVSFGAVITAICIVLTFSRMKEWD